MKRSQKLFRVKSKHILWGVFLLVMLTTSLFVYESWQKSRDSRARDQQVRQTLVILRGYADIRWAIAETESLINDASNNGNNHLSAIHRQFFDTRGCCRYHTDRHSFGRCKLHRVGNHEEK